MGPLVTADHRKRVEGYIEKGVAEGAKPLFFSNLSPTARVIQLKISPSETLAADKVATLVRGDPPSVPILMVSRGNLFLQKALQSIPVNIFELSESADPADHARAWAAALVLLTFVLVSSLTARLLLARNRRKLGL